MFFELERVEFRSWSLLANEPCRPDSPLPDEIVDHVMALPRRVSSHPCGTGCAARSTSTPDPDDEEECTPERYDSWLKADNGTEPAAEVGASTREDRELDGRACRRSPIMTPEKKKSLSTLPLKEVALVRASEAPS